MFKNAIIWLHKTFVAPKSPRAQVVEALDDILNSSRYYAKNAVLLVFEVDDLASLKRKHAGEDLEAALAALEDRLREGILRRDVVRRIDSGHFALVLSPLHGRTVEDMVILASQIQSLCSVPLPAGKTMVRLTVSIGCALADLSHLNSGAEMLEAARIAQIEAAGQGPAGLRFYDEIMGEQVRLQRDLGQEITRAMETGDIQAYFQPQIALKTRRLSGFEVLARWDHETRGLIPPADFLPVLEEAGQMRALGQLMLRDALKALQMWDAAGLGVPRVSINMCAEELRHPNIVEDISAQLKEYDIAPKRLVIEVLETVYVGDTNDPIIRNLARIAHLGCQIDLDDFGTGHASIKSVRYFGVDRIKIDRSYVSEVDHLAEQQQIVATILAMARNMEVETLAEGVETDAEIDHLASLGCGHAQGYAIAKPLALSKTLDWITSYGNGVAQPVAGQSIH